MYQEFSKRLAFVWKRYTTRLLYWSADVSKAHAPNGQQPTISEEAVLEHLLNQLVGVTDALHVAACKSWR